MASPDRVCPRCSAPLEASARFCAACGHALARLSPGQVVDGRYEILEKIAEGGMGEVYRVRHLHLDEIRIIKVTKPEAAGDAAAARRFQEEARLATLVRHPHVAALYDFSRQPDGSYYMVWEFIDGVTLQDWLRRNGPMDPALALDVARQVLAGLSEIHAQGIVHRDLSPDNIMLSAEGPRLRARIIDLGIAKRVASESLAMTGTGLFLGKLKYCSPEQAGALPAGQTLDARTDVYSFGVVLYEMLSGKAPFESATPEGYLGKHLHAPAPPLDVSALPPGIGAPLAAIVRRALEKSRDRRYASARELSDALAPLTRAEADRAPALVAVPPLPRSGRSGRLVASVLVAGSALAVGSFWIFVRGSRPPAERIAAARKPSPTASARTTVSTTLVPTMAPPAPISAVPAPEATRSEGESAAAPPIPEPIPDDTAAAPLDPPAMRQSMAVWKASPNEGRARRAPEIARIANRFVADHPAAPLTREIEDTLPVYLRLQATTCLDHAQPVLAHLYFRAYRLLRFAPADPELERRFQSLRPADAAPGPRRRPTAPAADGR